MFRVTRIHCRLHLSELREWSDMVRFEQCWKLYMRKMETIRETYESESQWPPPWDPHVQKTPAVPGSELVHSPENGPSGACA